MRKRCSVNLTMLEMCTQFLKCLRKRDINVYRTVVCAKRFVSVYYRISPMKRVFFVIENERGNLSYIGVYISHEQSNI